MKQHLHRRLPPGKFLSTFVYNDEGQGRLAFQKELFLSTVIYLGLHLLSFSYDDCFLSLSIALVLGKRLLSITPRVAKASFPAALLGCPCSFSSHVSLSASGLVKSSLSEGASGAAGKRPWRTGIHKSLSYLCPKQGNGLLYPAAYLCESPYVPLADSTSSELWARHRLFFLLLLSPSACSPSQGWPWLRCWRVGRKAQCLTSGDLDQTGSKETQIPQEVYKGFFRNIAEFRFWSSLMEPKATGIPFPHTSYVFCIKH